MRSYVLLTSSSIAELFADSFGEPLEEVFSEFPDSPIASGSIAQVYKAKLKDSGADTSLL
jgi:predicted unusual protein kinase regulating ubiquinone biosynthesis (AarF/ABC1/UbiB family)